LDVPDERTIHTFHTQTVFQWIQASKKKTCFFRMEIENGGSFIQ
jgi:hypothetical protein